MPRIIAIALLAAACCLAQDDKPPQDDKAASAIPDLEKTAQGLYMHGDYEGSRQSLLQAWDLAQQLPKDDPQRYDVLKRLATVRAAVGEFADADNFLQLAISWREQNLGPDDPKIVDDVLLSVGYARGQKDYARALGIMRSRVLRLHTEPKINAGASIEDAFYTIEVADDQSRIAQIQMEMKKPEDAIQSLNIALGIRTRLLGPLDPSLVYDLDRLAGIQITLREYDKAEETYRHALVVRETLYGKVHADLIATLDGLAYALFGQKKYDDAEPVYQRLLALWITSMGTDKNAMVAAALDKMAVFYADQKKWEQSRDAATRANAIRAYLLAEGLSVEASQRIDEGAMAEAIPIYKRAIKILDPPNEVYDEERATLQGMEKEVEKVVNKPPSKTPPPARK
ncbi:MAG TPA: tetratricopeptide repeat protein [Bryobacteraceae bacterium]|nr:tetratricopeptide repeat protein [Bryobacteraceae bacterium]